MGGNSGRDMGCGSSAQAAPLVTEPAKVEKPADPAPGHEDAAKHEDTLVYDEDEALQGFLKDLEKIPANNARTALLGGEYKDRAKEVEAMTDEQVMTVFKHQSLALWAEMGSSPEKWDDMLAGIEDTALQDKQKAEALRAEMAPKTQAVKSRRRSISEGLSEDAAYQGFLNDIANVPADLARAGLLGGTYKNKEAEVEGMTDEQVLTEYRNQSIKLWHEMGNEPEKWDEMLDDTNKTAESAKKALSPHERAGRSRRNSLSAGLTEEEAMAGFLAEVAQVPADQARQGLLVGSWAGKNAVVDEMTDEQVLEEYKKQSLEVWNQL